MNKTPPKAPEDDASADKDERQFLLDRFGPQYQRTQVAVLRDIERCSHGCDYGGTSWTTEAEAGEIAEHLELGPGRRLLEVGAGAGWPSLYMVRLSGCDADLTDLPLAGLRAASVRAQADQTLARCRFVVADGAQLPFVGPTFDAIHHADVLCCLSAKLETLKACRAVIRPDGVMAFTVIYVSEGLTGAAREKAIACGPPFIDADASYPEMLEQAGWRIRHQADLTDKFANTARTVLGEENRRADELIEVLGQADYDERLARRRHTVAGIEEGLNRRAMFVVTPSA